MNQRHSAVFVVCVDNSGYPASLERNKLYRVIPDASVEAEGDLRVVDESGEDYLYPADRFVGIELSQTLRRALLKAS